MVGDRGAGGFVVCLRAGQDLSCRKDHGCNRPPACEQGCQRQTGLAGQE
jgi:hypothetical protein